jgi:tRNA dimethylallyltransferase
MQEKQKIIIVVGPTASGKSDLAVTLAKKFGGEVISADSRQVYSGLNIGTGKITKREMKGVPHYMLDVISPRRTFTAYDFVRLAQKSYSSVLQNTRIPIIAGGTGFYIDAFLGNIKLPNIPANEDLRKRLEKKSTSELFNMLKSKDPKRASTIDKSNRRRLIRAIEISLKSTPIITKDEPLYDMLWIGIKPDREILRKKIEVRNVRMLQKGLIAEVKKLHEKRVSWKRIEEFGFEYKYVANFVRGKIAKNEMIEQMNNKTWQFSKRQMTYWRRNKNIFWFSPRDIPKMQKLVSVFLEK